MPTDRFELRRKGDDLVYVFERDVRPDGTSGFRRTDGDHWIVRHADFGWVAWDYVADAVTGRPWSVPLNNQDDAAPPEGEWVSRKGDRSYVYALVYAPADAAG